MTNLIFLNKPTDLLFLRNLGLTGNSYVFSRFKVDDELVFKENFQLISFIELMVRLVLRQYDRLFYNDCSFVGLLVVMMLNKRKQNFYFQEGAINYLDGTKKEKRIDRIKDIFFGDRLLGNHNCVTNKYIISPKNKDGESTFDQRCIFLDVLSLLSFNQLTRLENQILKEIDRRFEGLTINIVLGQPFDSDFNLDVSQLDSAYRNLINKAKISFQSTYLFFKRHPRSSYKPKHLQDFPLDNSVETLCILFNMSKVERVNLISFYSTPCFYDFGNSKINAVAFVDGIEGVRDYIHDQ